MRDLILIVFLSGFTERPMKKYVAVNSCSCGDFVRTGELRFSFLCGFTNHAEPSQIHPVKQTQHPVLFSQEVQRKVT